MAAAGAALAIGAVAVAAVKMAVDFDKGLREVNTLLRLPEAQFKVLQAETIELTKLIGITAKETVPALYQAISAGIPRGNVMEFLRVAGQAAIGGVTTLEVAVDGLTSVVNAYGVETLPVKKAADLMFTAVRLGKTTFEELSASLFNVVPIAAAVGVSFEQVTAALAAMTVQGTPTTVATTQLRQLILALTAPTVRQVKVLNKLGLEFNRSTLAEKGLAGMTKELIDQLGGNDAMLKRVLGSTEALQAALILGGAGAQTFADDLDAMSTSVGAVKAAFEIMEESTSVRLARMRVNFEAAMLILGGAILPFVDALAMIPAEALAAAAGIAAVVLVAGGLALVPWAAIAAGIVGMTFALGTLAASPVVLTVLTMTAAVIAFNAALEKFTGAGLREIWGETARADGEAVVKIINLIEARSRRLAFTSEDLSMSQIRTVETMDELRRQAAGLTPALDKLTGVEKALRLQLAFFGRGNLAREFNTRRKAVEELTRALVAQGVPASVLITLYTGLDEEGRAAMEAGFNLNDVMEGARQTVINAANEFRNLVERIANVDEEALGLISTMDLTDDQFLMLEKAVFRAGDALFQMRRELALMQQQMAAAGAEASIFAPFGSEAEFKAARARVLSAARQADIDISGTLLSTENVEALLPFADQFFVKMRADITGLTDVVSGFNAALGSVGDTIGSVAQLSEAQQAAERTAARQTTEVVEAFITASVKGIDPAGAVARVKSEQQRLNEQWELVARGLRSLGVDTVERFREMFDAASRTIEDGSKRIGEGLLGFLIARRLGMDLDPGKGLISFAHGGIVPGQVGAPRLIQAHGGEAVLTRAQQAGGSVTYNNVERMEVGVRDDIPGGIDTDAAFTVSVEGQRRAFGRSP